MAQITLLSFDHDYLPAVGTFESWAIDVNHGLRRGKPGLLPAGVRLVDTHHSQDLSLIGKQQVKIAENAATIAEQQKKLDDLRATLDTARQSVIDKNAEIFNLQRDRAALAKELGVLKDQHEGQRRTIERLLDEKTRAANSKPAGSYSYLQLEACLCVWEHLLSKIDRVGDNPHGEPEGNWGAFLDFWEERGSAEMRLTVTPRIAEWVLAVYDAGKTIDPDYWDMVSYDWDVVPAIVDEINWIGDSWCPNIVFERERDTAVRVHDKLVEHSNERTINHPSYKGAKPVVRDRGIVMNRPVPIGDEQAAWAVGYETGGLAGWTTQSFMLIYPFPA